MTTRCHSVSSFHSPDCWSFQRREVARVKFVTATPLGVNLVSASLPRWPSRITLLMLRDAILHCTLSYGGARESRARERAGGGNGARFILGEVGGDFGQSVFESAAGSRTTALRDSGQMPPGNGIGTQGLGDLEIECAGEFVFGVGEIFAEKEENAAIEVGFAGGQILRVGERGAGGEAVIGQGRIHAAGEVFGAGAQEQSAGGIGRGVHGGIESGNRGGGISAEELRAAPIGQGLGQIGTGRETRGER